MKETGQLKHNTVVSTVMSNLGFTRHLKQIILQVIKQQLVTAT